MVNRKLILSEELRRLIELRIAHTIKGIEETLRDVVFNQNITPEDLQENLKSLGESFNLLSQKWNLEILYTLFLKGTVSFSGLKRILGVNSRTLSNKLKNLKEYGYVERLVLEGPPLRVEYALTRKGREMVLLALPLLYYSSSLSQC
ncbi:helix-turn-helix transcriptional regulator [Candidatus Bathyarchaeota archaeon]|nr:helix-turn-helix transcriptional regulator [Candidatus Bathyarchaeota archaeon]